MRIPAIFATPASRSWWMTSRPQPAAISSHHSSVRTRVSALSPATTRSHSPPARPAMSPPSRLCRMREATTQRLPATTASRFAVNLPNHTNFINGGGFLVNTASSGTYAGIPGQKTHFGFNVKFNKGGHESAREREHHHQQQRAHLSDQNHIHHLARGNGYNPGRLRQLPVEGQHPGHHRPAESDLDRRE
jgi:hypothetical protein